MIVMIEQLKNIFKPVNDVKRRMFERFTNFEVLLIFFKFDILHDNIYLQKKKNNACQKLQ